MNNAVTFRGTQPRLCQQCRKGEHGGVAHAAAWLRAVISLRTAPEQKPLKGTRTQWWSLAAFQHAGARRGEVAGWGPHVRAAIRDTFGMRQRPRGGISTCTGVFQVWRGTGVDSSNATTRGVLLPVALTR